MNSKTIQHTPGPWIADMPKGIIYADGAMPIASVYDNPDTGNEHIGQEPSAANARLIAAAPELLAALRKMLRLHYDTAKASAEGLEASNMAEDAIRKATRGK